AVQARSLTRLHWPASRISWTVSRLRYCICCPYALFCLSLPTLVVKGDRDEPYDQPDQSDGSHPPSGRRTRRSNRHDGPGCLHGWFEPGRGRQSARGHPFPRSEEHTSELQSRFDLV